MSREIKFRAWDGEDMFTEFDSGLVWLEVDNDGLSLHMMEQCFETGSGVAEENHRPVKVDDAVIMQFTGLTDKNGKDIYESDIIESEIHDNPSRYEIEFIEGGFCATHPNLERYPTDINHFYSSVGCSIEVIGNIHETPDLMEG